MKSEFNIKYAVLAALILVSSVSAGTGTDAFSFLKIKSSSRGASLGDGFVSVASDINAAAINPAAIASINNLSFSLMHLSYVAETSCEFASAALPLNKNLTVGLSMVYFNYGAIGLTSENLNGDFAGTNGSYSPYDLLGMATIGYKLNKNINLGLNVKYVLEQIGSVSINALLFDAGVQYSNETLGAGLSIYNAGAKVNNDKAPAGIRGGVSLKTDLLKDKDLLILVGGNYGLADSRSSYGVSFEYCFDNMFSLRSGYTLNTDTGGLNVGAGYKGNMDEINYQLDYNFSLLNDLGSAHRINVTFAFGDLSSGNKAGSKKPAQRKSNSGIRYFNPTRR